MDRVIVEGNALVSFLLEGCMMPCLLQRWVGPFVVEASTQMCRHSVWGLADILPRLWSRKGHLTVCVYDSRIVGWPDQRHWDRVT